MNTASLSDSDSDPRIILLVDIWRVIIIPNSTSVQESIRTSKGAGDFGFALYKLPRKGFGGMPCDMAMGEP